MIVTHVLVAMLVLQTTDGASMSKHQTEGTMRRMSQLTVTKDIIIETKQGEMKNNTNTQENVGAAIDDSDQMQRVKPSIIRKESNIETKKEDIATIIDASSADVLKRRSSGIPSLMFGDSLPPSSRQRVNGDAIKSTLLQHWNALTAGFFDTSNSFENMIVPGNTGGQEIEFKLQTEAGQNNLKIPKQVLITSHFKTLAEGLEHRGGVYSSLESLGITSDLHVQYFNDDDCHSYLEAHAPDLAPIFLVQKSGSYKGDICRTAYLAREGGFYVDFDMEIRVPLKKIVDDDTTFMAMHGGCLNALIATTPGNPVMQGALENLRQQFRDLNGVLPGSSQHVGSLALRHGALNFMKNNCPQYDWLKVDTFTTRQFKCGPEQSIRFNTEEFFGHCQSWGPTICPESHSQNGDEYGLFSAPKYGMAEIQHPSSKDIATQGERLIGWSRIGSCHKLGCGLTGGTP